MAATGSRAGTKRSLIFMAFWGLLGCGSGGQPPFRSVEPDEAESILAKPGAVLLDVRTPQENKAEKIPGSLLIPLQDLEGALTRLPADKAVPIVVYCRSGNRSKTASKFLGKKGYREVYNLRGGIIAWAASGRRTVGEP